MVHDRDAVGDVADRLNVMADEDHRQTELLLEIGEEVEDLRAHRHVQRGGRLIGDDRLRAQGQSAGDGHTLPLPTRELARERIQHGGRQAHHVGELLHAGLALGRRTDLVHMQRIGQLLADDHAGVERGGRILEDHRHDPAHGAPIGGAAFGHLPTLEEDLPVGRRLQATHDIGQGGLAGAGFTDQADPLPRGEREGDIVDGLDPVRLEDRAGAGLEVHLDVAQIDDGGGGSRGAHDLDLTRGVGAGSTGAGGEEHRCRGGDRYQSLLGIHCRSPSVGCGGASTAPHCWHSSMYDV